MAIEKTEIMSILTLRPFQIHRLNLNIKMEGPPQSRWNLLHILHHKQNAILRKYRLLKTKTVASEVLPTDITPINGRPKQQPQPLRSENTARTSTQMALQIRLRKGRFTPIPVILPQYLSILVQEIHYKKIECLELLKVGK